MRGEEVENEVVGVPVPYPGALVSLWWRPVLCPSLASFAFCGLQLQRSHPLRQLLGECPPPPAQGRSLWGGKGWVLWEECQLFDRDSCEEPFCTSFSCPLQRLLSALRFLNLSHNHIQDCKGFLMVSVSCQVLVDLGLGWLCPHHSQISLHPTLLLVPGGTTS